MALGTRLWIPKHSGSVHDKQHVLQRLRDSFIQEVTLVRVHILVHEVQYSQPESSEGRQGEQWGQVLEEHLAKQSSSSHPRLLHPDGIVRILQQEGEQGEQNLVEARLPLHRRQGLEVMDQQRPLEVRQGLHAHLASGVAAQPGNAL